MPVAVLAAKSGQTGNILEWRTAANAAGLGTVSGVINASGNVGIGTASPVSLLDVAGGARVGTDAVCNDTKAGMLAWNASTLQVCVSTAAGFVNVASASGGSSQWTTTGSDIYYNTGKVGIGTTSPTNTLSLGGDAARTIWMERSATAATTGNSLTLQAGGTKSGNTDQNGGDLVLSSGTSTGTGTSNITLKAFTAGSSGTADNAATAVAIISGGGINIATGRLSLAGVNAISVPAADSTSLAIGNSALNVLTTTAGSYNDTAVGYQALAANTTGNGNTAVGYQSLNANTSGGNNTAIGIQALWQNTTGFNNAALGRAALVHNTTGFNNAAVGQSVLFSNTTGSSNTAVGNSALQSNTTGGVNTAVGQGALANNTTANFNTATGSSSLQSNTTGANNTATGNNSLVNNTIGSGNTAFGYSSLPNVTTGNNNTAIGYNTALGITTGSNNTIVGASVSGLAAGISNNIILADGSGNQRINVDSSGNVGIGSTTPASKLDVAGGARVGGDAVCSAAKAGMLAWNTNTLQVCTDAGTFTNIASSLGGSSQWTTTGSDIYYNTGKVGIGTATPGATIEVDAGAAATKVLVLKGAASQTANLFEVQDSVGNVLNSINSFGDVSVNTLVAAPYNNNRTITWPGLSWTLNGNGAITAVNGNTWGLQATNGFTFTKSGGPSSAVGYTFNASQTSGTGPDAYRFQLNGTTKLVINSSGNIGINTTALKRHFPFRRI